MKVKYILAVASITCAVAACDVLDIAPLDTLTDKSYWTTVNDLKLYANGFYNNLDAPSVNKDDVSDNCVTTNYAPILFNESTVPASGGGWDWENIRACNFFMKRYHTVQGTPESINPYVAEIRFFRALDYYGKIKSFGDVLGTKVT
ncbi:putative outer membrane protein [Bacteroides pyogenes JCM 10003]|nr:putative outer membrane protein [Bacteroides pyogenes JCM 10003]